MKQKLLFLLLAVLCIPMQAQVIKVDLNMEGRNENEVNEPGYTPWYTARLHSVSMTEQGVTFTMTALAPGDQATFRASWVKELVQGPYYMRLVNDGIAVDNDTLLAYPGKGAVAEMRISGLPLGRHTLQTYHNVWSNGAKTDFAPFNVYLNDDLVHANIKPSCRVLTNAEATCLFTDMEVKEDGEDMVLRIEAIEDFVPEAGKAANVNVYLNAFELNTDDRSKQACNPVPAYGDLHIDADDGSYLLEWDPAINHYTESHVLYLGKDSTTVANATPQDDEYLATLPLETQEYRLNELYSMNTYYWRVDQIDSAGLTTRGDVWCFKPRQLAFADAEGYGRFATGGRGGQVVYVTNLNNSGPGSFREAATNRSGPRTIVFNVSGIIDLNGRLVMDPFVTVAGQTAPGKGICFRGAPVGVGKEGVVRFIRVRLGAGETADGLGMAGNDHSIVDHCSIGWAIDECFSSRNAKNITLQRSLISEALNVAGHKNYPAGSAHGYAGSVGGDVGSLHHNLLAHCAGRNWSLAGGLDGAGYYAGRMDIFNMVVYNWDRRTTDGGAHEVNFVGNYYKAGAACNNTTILNAQLEGAGKGSQSYYVKDNILELANGTISCDGSNAACATKYTLSGGQKLDWEVWVDEPFFPSYATIHSAKDAYKTVLSDVGCTLPIMDDHDKRMVHETLTGTWTYRGSKSGKPGLIDHQDDAGGYEDYGNAVRPEGYDSDMDGLPDWWEELIGTDPNSPAGDFSDANADLDRDGYTNLDDYLEWMSKPHYEITSSMSLDLSDFTKGFEKSPVHRIVSTTNCQVSLDGTLATITVGENVKQNALGSFEFEVEDAEGFKMTRLINLYMPMSTAIEGPDSESMPSFAYVEDRCIHVVAKELKEVSVFNQLGQLLYKAEDLSGSTFSTPRMGLGSDVFIVRIKTHAGQKTQKLIAR